MIKRLFYIITITFSIFAKAQETIPMYQQYLMDGDFLFNPAYLGKNDHVVINGNYQKEFSKFDESPNVQSVGVHANIFDRVGAGISFFKDQNGPISANGLSVGASYFIPLSDEDGRKDQFSFGTSVNLYNQLFDFTKINAEDPNDPYLYEGANSIFIAYSNIGLQATYKNFSAGISVADIPLTNNIPIVNGIEPSPTKFYINAGYEWMVTSGISLEPSVMLNLNTNSSRMIDANLMANVMSGESKFGFGVSYRMAQSTFGRQNLSISPIVRIKASQFTFGASYNIGVSDISQYAGNSFMLSLGYNFDNFINSRGFRLR